MAPCKANFPHILRTKPPRETHDIVSGNLPSLRHVLNKQGSEASPVFQYVVRHCTLMSQDQAGPPLYKLWQFRYFNNYTLLVNKIVTVL